MTQEKRQPIISVEERRQCAEAGGLDHVEEEEPKADPDAICFGNENGIYARIPRALWEQLRQQWQHTWADPSASGPGDDHPCPQETN